MENEYTESVLQTGLDQQYKIFYSSEANLVEMIDSSTIKLKKTCNHNYFLYRMRISIDRQV